MFCENCGANVPDGDMFCQNCGERMKAAAPVNMNNGQPVQLQAGGFGQPIQLQAGGNMQPMQQESPYEQVNLQQAGTYAQPSGQVMMPYAEPAAPSAPSVFTQPNMDYSQPPVPVNGAQPAANNGYNRPIGNGQAVNSSINQYSSTYRQSFSNRQNTGTGSSVPASVVEGSTAAALGLIFGIFSILIGIIGGITFGVIGAGIGMGLAIIGTILAIAAKKASRGVNGTGGIAFSIMGIVICALFFVACAAGGKRTFGYGSYGIIGGTMFAKDDVEAAAEDLIDQVEESTGSLVDDISSWFD